MSPEMTVEAVMAAIQADCGKRTGLWPNISGKSADSIEIGRAIGCRG